MSTATPTPAEDPPLHVLEVHAANFMRIVALDAVVKPEGLTIFSGRNAHGKTSALDAIAATLEGGAAIPEMPVRAGQERGETTVVVGEDGKPLYTVRRVYRDGGTSSLEVRAVDGAKIPSPQRLLDTLNDTHGFNPVEFANPSGCRTVAAANERRIEMLLAIAPVRMDLKAHDAERARVFAERTGVAKRAKDLEAVVKDAAASKPPDGPVEDETPLLTSIASAETATKLRDAADARRKELEDENKRLEATILRLETELVEARKRTEVVAAEWNLQAQAASKALPDVAALRVRLDEMRKRNEARRGAVADAARAEERAKQLRAEREREVSLTAAIEKMDRERGEAIAAANFPVKQLTIDTEGRLAIRTKDGSVVPFSQASTAQRIKVAFVVMASRKPKLRACLIPNGNDLDQESMAELARIAAHFRFQVFLERIVPDSAGACIMFEGNSIAGPGATGATA